ncbi:hypothetical protein KC326_g24 [Hortaea werneckii]|nr:hypothetical protein KC326_g24 [Hortaea werneckii]
MFKGESCTVHFKQICNEVYNALVAYRSIALFVLAIGNITNPKDSGKHAENVILLLLICSIIDTGDVVAFRSARVRVGGRLLYAEDLSMLLRRSLGKLIEDQVVVNVRPDRFSYVSSRCQRTLATVRALSNGEHMRRHFQPVLPSIAVEHFVRVDSKVLERINRDQHMANVGVNLAVFEALFEVVVNGLIADFGYKTRFVTAMVGGLKGSPRVGQFNIGRLLRRSCSVSDKDNRRKVKSREHTCKAQLLCLTITCAAMPPRTPAVTLRQLRNPTRALRQLFDHRRYVG